MKSLLKYEIKSDVRDIIAEIDYEEYMFNKIFKTNVVFRNSYKKFNLIYNIYGPQAYRKFVPKTYKCQDMVELINSKEYALLCDRHGKKVFKNLRYMVTLQNFKLYYGKFRAGLYKMCHLFSRHKIHIKGDMQLMLPESIPTIESK